ncbi:carboxymuconolactone decarboxylase family protein [Chloroflexota bacterium]
MQDYFYDKDMSKYRAKFAELKGDAVDAFGQFNNKVFNEGVLSLREKELIAVASAHITRCPYCIDRHTRMAKEAGATDEEIAESILVAAAMSAGASMAHASLSMRSLSE